MAAIFGVKHYFVGKFEISELALDPHMCMSLYLLLVYVYRNGLTI